ncbi:MAG: STAS domain-containing protein [Candidatus Krumholzibacteriota bacterium]|nr:STAS domain-containing protein [Candidatus Krumholzibacteriota bacterium]
MKYKTRESSGVVIVELSGKLMGGSDSAKFRDLIYDLLEKGKKNIVIDLGKVSWVNSAGVGILISGYTTMRKHQGDLKLLNVSNKIKSLLYVTKLNLIFESFEDETKVIQSYFEN